VALADRLRAAGLNFQQQGGFLVGMFTLEGNRTQVFFLDPDADDYMGMQDYDFVSVVGPADDASKVKKACELAGKHKRGGIIIRQNLIMMKFDLPVSLDDRALVAHVAGVCKTADDLEHAIFGGDAR